MGDMTDYRVRTPENIERLVLLARGRKSLNLNPVYHISNETSYIVGDGFAEVRENSPIVTVDCFLDYIELGEVEKFLTLQAPLGEGVFEKRPGGPHNIDDCDMSHGALLSIRAGIAYPIDIFRKGGVKVRLPNCCDEIQKLPELVLIEAEAEGIDPAEYRYDVFDVINAE